MLLSIVVLSYNRPAQVERILRNFEGFVDERVQLIIKDDRSPRIDEIRQVFELYKSQIFVDCLLYENEENMGYDLNLWSSFFKFNSDFIFLLSDDDYINVELLPSLVDQISLGEHKVYFTPICRNGKIRRFNIEKYNAFKFSNVIYNSILFSGLIFNVNAVKGILIDVKDLDNSIYSQVILSSIIIYNEKGFGVAPSGILYVGGDGENYFGKNPNSIEKEKLADRSSAISNLHYQRFLLLAVNKVADYTSSDIYNDFLKLYKYRLIGYMLRVRSMGIKVYVEFIKGFLQSHAKNYLLHRLFLVFLIFCPPFISKIIYNFGVNHIRNDD